jgi:hypothetical protein
LQSLFRPDIDEPCTSPETSFLPIFPIASKYRRPGFVAAVTFR